MDSSPPQTITTGTRDTFRDGDKQLTNKSPRSTLEGPLYSNSTLASAEQLTEAPGMGASKDWQVDDEEDDDYYDDEDYDEGSMAHGQHDSGSGGESNLRRSARNHGTDNRRVSPYCSPIWEICIWQWF